jgi:hypothetical protein
LHFAPRLFALNPKQCPAAFCRARRRIPSRAFLGNLGSADDAMQLIDSAINKNGTEDRALYSAQERPSRPSSINLRISDGSIMIRRPIRMHLSFPHLMSRLSVQWALPMILAASSMFNSRSKAA